MTDGPLIVQSDKTLLLEIDHERAQDCRKAIAPFAELERSPELAADFRDFWARLGATLTFCSSMTELRLMRCRLDGADLAALAPSLPRCGALERIVLDGNRIVEAAALERLTTKPRRGWLRLRERMRIEFKDASSKYNRVELLGRGTTPSGPPRRDRQD